MSDDVIPHARLEASLAIERESFRRAKPFPHLVLDDVLPPAWIAQAVAEFPSPDDGRWTHYRHVNEDKLGKSHRDELSAHWQRTIDAFQSPRFVAWLAALSGIDGLCADPSLQGGGLHLVPSGGFLNVHADFTVHPRIRTWQRRLNVLLYLNDDWDESWGGELELWNRTVTRCEVRVVPRYNRMVVFATDHDSFHGHPEPLRCPPGRSRNSLALYYFTEEARPTVRSTEYRARPGDGLHGWAIWADKLAVRAYDAVKRRAGFDDAAVSRALRWASSLRRR